MPKKQNKNKMEKSGSIVKSVSQISHNSEQITKKSTTGITANTLIMEAVSKYPETIEVFHKHGMYCFGCAMARMETVGDGALSHSIDIGRLVKDLNAVAEKKK